MNEKPKELLVSFTPLLVPITIIGCIYVGTLLSPTRQTKSDINAVSVSMMIQDLDSKINDLNKLTDAQIKSINDQISTLKVVAENDTTASTQPAKGQKQCNPSFKRGDIVRHRGLPEQKYVVVSMNNVTCDAYIRHPNLTGMESGTDLLELAN